MTMRTLFLILSLTASICLYGQTATTRTRSFTFPPAGLGSTETARINVVNVAANSSSGTAASCAVSISFLNAAGNAIGTATNLTVTSGQISSASLTFAQAGLTGVRGTIRGHIQLTATSGVPCELQSSF